MLKKKLIIGRHAKSSWDSGVNRDFDRPLNNRGRNDLPIMVSRLISQQISPDIILHSAAVRTTETAIYYHSQFPDAQIISNKDLYNNTVDAYLAVLQEFTNKNTILLVGHNPTVTELINDIGNVQLDNMPTCGLACFKFDAFEDLRQKKGELQFLEFPKMFK